jgi:hypothetical protein
MCKDFSIRAHGNGIDVADLPNSCGFAATPNL